MTFFHGLFKFSKTLGFAVSFKKSNPKLVLERFFNLKQFNRHKLWSSPKMRAVYAANYSSLSYIVLAL